MVLDIGNSRTCGLLFEDGDFTKAAMLSLRDLTDPAHTYEHPFDMRLVFGQADFANDIVIEEEDMFRYPSMVRIGDEARRPVYRSLESEGLWAGTSNYSSPKRYLWDEAPFKQKWEYLTAETDPLYIRESENIYVPGLFRPLQQQGRVYTRPFRRGGAYRRAYALFARLAYDFRSGGDIAAGIYADQQQRVPPPSRRDKLQACARESDCDMPHGDAARRADKAAPVCR